MLNLQAVHPLPLTPSSSQRRVCCVRAAVEPGTEDGNINHESIVWRYPELSQAKSRNVVSHVLDPSSSFDPLSTGFEFRLPQLQFLPSLPLHDQRAYALCILFDNS